ncbi:hypothetical protein B0H19DRAFT_1135547 [Mycena capillaripes]|nr:hypothetical protein B0H19DRAFT_1135547 [Mycena capillaripes]
MSTSLPDEIISEILCLSALKIPDEVFSDTAAASPFSSYTRSTSAFLLVCKDWLRVSTPLLYNVVVVRSKAQAEALETALKSTKDLGTFIKKLRIEGGFGLTMKTILKASPNITDLVLSLAIWSSDGVSGLCQALHLIDPIRLVIHDIPEPKDNQQNLKLVKKVMECIQLWKRLNTVDIPYSFDWTSPGFSRCENIGKALKTAPSLEQVIIPIPNFHMIPPFLSQILENPSLKSLKIKEPLPNAWIGPHIRELIDTYPNLKELIQFSILEDFAEIAPSSNPLFVPMESAPQEVQDKIWARILYFALGTDELDSDLAMDVHVPNFSGVDPMTGFLPSSNIILVSKQFKTLSTPFFYRHIVLEGDGHLSRFSATLRGDPTIAKHVRSLSVNKDAVLPSFHDAASLNSDSDWREMDVSPSQAEELLLPILPLLNGLVSFTGCFYNATMYPPHPQILIDTLTVPWTTLLALGAAAGANLRRLCIEVVPPVEIQSPLVLDPFLALRSLEWKCSVEFNLDPELVLAAGTFANLECISLLEYHSSFLIVLGSAELPALCRMFFHGDVAPTAERFFERHDSKLTEILLVASDSREVNVLDACPSLPLLICSSKEEMDQGANILPSVELFAPTEPHLHLTKIVLNIFVYSRKEEKTMGAFFNSLDTALLPALREIQVTELYWPTTEREIAKSAWVQFAEKLLTKDVKLTDMDGKHWTPRLKSGR